MTSKRQQRHQVRRLALQALYQLDARGEGDLEQIIGWLDEAQGSATAHDEALKLARGAWADREAADRLTGELAPAWPATRQPPVDRNILRLGYHEMATGRAPAAVVINEAVELAKTFGSDRSPGFINGLLDKMARRTDPNDKDDSEHPTDDNADNANPGSAPPNDTFLTEALRNTRINPTP